MLVQFGDLNAESEISRIRLPSRTSRITRFKFGDIFALRCRPRSE